VDQVLHLLSKHKLFLKQSKCAFGASEVEYLGHIVGKDGVWVDPKKIEAMKDWPHPKTLKILCGFLGLNGILSQVCWNYGKIAAPLTALLKKNAFSWTPTTDQSFQALKDAMCTTPVLALPDFTKTFVLECDVSGKELGQSSCKMVDLWLSLENNYQSDIWANPPMKRKCWLFCMQWISGILIYWGNASKLKLIIVASSIFWNK
jgi:hypothetical protein